MKIVIDLPVNGVIKDNMKCISLNVFVNCRKRRHLYLSESCNCSVKWAVIVVFNGT